MTIAIGPDYGKISEFTHPTLQKYAKRTKSDFYAVTTTGLTSPHWEKFQIYDLLDKYDRILYIDSDILVRDDCPNIFDLVPQDKIGMFNEAPFTASREISLYQACMDYNMRAPNWNGKYYNTGVMVVSKAHKELFKKPDKEIFNFFEQGYINAVVAQGDDLVFDLPYDYNRMTCMDRFIGIDRHASYMIHYAGFPSLAGILEIIKADVKKWSDDKRMYGRRNYKHHILITVNGGLGDQICAEPSIRYMKKNLYPDDEMIITTHYPELFKHLKEDLGIKVYEHKDRVLEKDTPYYSKETLPEPDTLQWSIVSNMMCHTVDYISISLMKRTLPLKDREIRLEPDYELIPDLTDIFGDDFLSDLVLVHPGKHWESKTFPVKYWQTIIDKLVQSGEKVVIIGKEEPGDPPTFIPGARGTVNVKCPKGAYDMRDKLSLNQLIALISQAKCLVSNDSAPIHIAGAFDTKIVLLPSCKHGDHILPYRNGSNYYNAISINKKLTIDDVDSRPTCIYSTTAEFTKGKWNEYLVEPKEVVKQILNFI